MTKRLDDFIASLPKGEQAAIHEEAKHLLLREMTRQELASLSVGKLYKAVATTPEERERGFVRVIDNSGEDYLYPTNRFEPVMVNGNLYDAAANVTLTAHVPALLRDMPQAEALASGKSMSALHREWIEERLDLPT